MFRLYILIQGHHALLWRHVRNPFVFEFFGFKMVLKVFRRDGALFREASKLERQAHRRCRGSKHIPKTHVRSKWFLLLGHTPPPNSVAPEFVLKAYRDLLGRGVVLMDLGSNFGLRCGGEVVFFDLGFWGEAPSRRDVRKYLGQTLSRKRTRKLK